MGKKKLGYTRISKDEDNERDAIENQKIVIENYCKKNNIEISEVLEDNNYSGYKFDRPSFNKLKEMVEKKEVDLIVVKDLSRIGRNNGHTLVFIEYLIGNGVQLISINDRIDTLNKKDMKTLGITTWYNELYIQDISEKIRSQIRAIMEKEGLVINPHYGYMKDPKDDKNIIIDEDVKDNIKLIFQLYLEGLGVRKIADYLNSHKIQTPAVHKKNKFGTWNNANNDYEHLWYETSVRRILKNDAYIGTLRCATTQRTMIKGGRRYTDKDEHIVHENYFDPIIDKETFDLVQKIAEQRVKKGVRAKNEKVHRYAGMLECGDCGKGFVARRHTRDGYVEYVCATYHRYGKELCTTHRVRETELNEIINNNLEVLISKAEQNLKAIDEYIAKYKSEKKYYDNSLMKLEIEKNKLKSERKNYAKQLAKSLITESEFKELTEETMADIERLENQITNLKEMKSINDKHKEVVIKSIDIMKEIISKKELTDVDLRLLIDKIVITNTDELNEKGNPKLKADIYWSVPFKNHEITPACDDVISWIQNFCFTIDFKMAK